MRVGSGGPPQHPSAPQLTLQACASSRATVSTSLGFSITRPVHPEKSMATSALSETLRCGEVWGDGGSLWAGGWGGAALTRGVGPIQEG